MNEVYVIAGGEWLRNNLNAIAHLWYADLGFHRKNCAHIVCSRGGRDVGTAANVMDLLAGWPCLCLSACWLMSVHRADY
ncbi:pilus assembly protein [Escherichia coli]|nr:pilus assembly protein [Escherichia coli]